MRIIKQDTFFLLLCLCFLNIYAQETTVKSRYLQIDGLGVLSEQSKTDVDNKLTVVYTIGGFVNLTEIISDDSPRPSYKTYFKPNGLVTSSKNNEKNKIQASINSQVFINFSHDYFIELFDGNTKKLLHKYQLKKVKSVPELQFERSINGKFQTVAIPAQEPPATFVVSVDEHLYFKQAITSRFNNLELSFRLINLQTKKDVQQVSTTGFGLLNLKENTTYELRFKYVIQPESEGVVYLKVQGKWYQSIAIYSLLGVIVILFVFLGVRWFFKSKIKRSFKRQQKIEQAALRLQSLLNPHFTFNALSSIQGLINTNRIEDANTYLQEFSSLLRKTLHKNQDVFTSLDQELEMMRLYLRLEALRFNFKWEIQVSSELDCSLIEVPTLLLQPLLENAIKHGLFGLREKGILLVVCKLGTSKEDLVISIKDNGIWKEESTKKGYGLVLTKERLMTINKLSKNQKIKLTYNIESGTEVQLTFKNWINIE